MVEKKICAAPIKFGPNRSLPATGTPAGYVRHRNAGEPACAPCLKGWSAHQVAYRAGRIDTHPRPRKPRNFYRPSDAELAELEQQLWADYPWLKDLFPFCSNGHWMPILGIQPEPFVKAKASLSDSMRGSTREFRCVRCVRAADRRYRQNQDHENTQEVLKIE